MKLPKNIDKVTTGKSSENPIYPYIGFLTIREDDNYAGDCYGMYWELGKENKEPIICEARHEESLLVPEFPNLDSFLVWSENDLINRK